MRIKVDVRDSNDQIEKRIIQQIQTKLNSALHRAAPAIRQRIQDLCDSLISGTEEYQSLLNGELLAELGIPDVNRRVENILATIKDNVEVTVIPVQTRGKKLHGGLNIGILRSGYDDILSLSDASYVSLPSGETIPWLQWLIGEGDRIVVLNFQVEYDLSVRERARSRTGLALMIPGSGWRVPPEYSGTYEDNFLTRAFNAVEVEAILARIMSQEIQSRI